MTSEFVDKLGQLLQVGDPVVWPHANRLEIGSIVKLNPKMVKVRKFEPPRKWSPSTWNKYPDDIVKLEGPAVTMYILKTSSNGG